MPAGIHLEKQLNARVNEEAHAIIRALCRRWQVSQAEGLERVLTEYFEQKGRSLRNAVRMYRRERRQVA